jgi:hypothetical protein
MNASSAVDHCQYELQTAMPTELEIARLKRAARAHAERFDELLAGDIPISRQALRKLLHGRIQFLPE